MRKVIDAEFKLVSVDFRVPWFRVIAHMVFTALIAAVAYQADDPLWSAVMVCVVAIQWPLSSFWRLLAAPPVTEEEAQALADRLAARRVWVGSSRNLPRS